MPVHDLGYRGWNYAKTPRYLRPIDVAGSGISLIWGRKWLRMMLMLSWLPIILPAAGIFAFEYSTSDSNAKQLVAGMLAEGFGDPELAVQAKNDPDSARYEVWSRLIHTYFRYPQLSAMVLLVGLIAPMLVSYDLRSKAYLLYFSRPLTVSEYILGKSAVLWFFLAVIVTVPALILYVVGVMLSPDLSVVIETWDIVLRILAASVALVVPTTALALCYSACTSESRYATFAWFATWILGYVAYYFLTFAPALMAGPPPRGRRGRGDDPFAGLDIDLDKWQLLSPYHTLGRVQTWIFDPDRGSGSVIPAMLLVTFVTIGSIWIVRNRINARLSV